MYLYVLNNASIRLSHHTAKSCPICVPPASRARRAAVEAVAAGHRNTSTTGRLQRDMRRPKDCTTGVAGRIASVVWNPCISKHLCIYIYIYKYICEYIYIYMCVCVCMYVCMYECICHALVGKFHINNRGYKLFTKSDALTSNCNTVEQVYGHVELSFHLGVLIKF